MGRPVGTDEAGAVDREADRQFLDRHVMDDLVVGALQEGRIDRDERLVTLRSARPAAKVTACCSAMPTSKVRSGNASPNRSSPVPDGMAAVIATMLSSCLRFLDQAVGEHLGVARRVGRRLGLRAGDDVELVDAVILVGGSSRPAHSPCPSGSRHGPAPARAIVSRTFFSTGSRCSRLWPSIGPT